MTTYKYNVDFDCWQKRFGFNDMYDGFFDLATSMQRANFEFRVGLNYCKLWIWKGDYVNLGAGAEIGIYKNFLLPLPHWYVDKSEAMSM